MRLFYYKAKQGNFGDDLNGWLWEALLPGFWSDESDVVFLGIGTIIGLTLPPARKVVVFSSGAGYAAMSGADRSNWTFAAVRGPLTAEVLKLPREAAVADGALLLATLPQFAPLSESERHGVIFIPHHHVLNDANWGKAASMAGVELVDPRGDCVEVIQRIRSAKLVLADSMHAAIIADTLRVPWIPLFSSRNSNTFKWLDWSLALGVLYQPVKLPIPSTNGAFRSVTQFLHHEDFIVTPPDRARAVAHFERTAARIVTPDSERTRYRIKKVLNFVPRTLDASGLTTAVDRRKTEETARVFAELSRRNGYLSEPAALANKVEELQSRLEKLKHFA